YKTDNSNEFIAVSVYRYGYYESQSKKSEAYFNSWKKVKSLKLTKEETGVRNGVKYYTYNFTDTNTTRNIKIMHFLHGLNSYYIEAFLDTVSGESEFVNTFLKTFDVGDTIIKGD